MSSPRATVSAAKTATVTAAGAVAGLVLVGEQGPVLCLFRRCTGGYCPGCGLTRAAGQLVRGDVAGAWHHHPFLVVAAIEAVLIVGVWAVWRSRPPRAPGLAPPGLAEFTAPWRSSLALANLGLLVAIWMARLALGAIPAPFA